MTRAGLIQPAIRPTTQRQDGQAPVGRDAKRPGKARKGRKKKKADQKGGLGVGASLGIGVGSIDAWEEDEDGQRRRKRANIAIGDDEQVYFADNSSDQWDPMASIAPEFKPQVAAGMASARSLTSGTTMPSRRAKKTS